MSEESTTVKVPVFNREEKSYQSWMVRFQAFSRVKGFSNVLVDAGITIAEADIETLELKPKYESGTTGARDADEEKQLRLGKKNLLAMAHLTMALGTEGLLNKIPLSYTTDWPGGLAFMMMEILKTKYAPQDRMAVVERVRKMNALTLGEGENPENLFELIKSIDNQFKDLTHGLTEQDKIAAVLDKGSKDYLIILANTAREKGTSLTMEHLEEAMRIQWRIEHGKDESKSGKSKEFNLSAFGGNCYHCGKPGHRVNKCPEKNKEDGKSGNNGGGKRKKFNGKCRTCGVQGHKAADCWKDEKNADKRPNWWKSSLNKEQGLSASDGTNDGGREFLLMSLN